MFYYVDLLNALGPVQSCAEAKILAQEDQLIYEGMDRMLQNYGIAKQAWNHAWTGKFSILMSN